jgi:hypothetical protein
MYEALIRTISEKIPQLHYDNLQPVFAPYVSFLPYSLKHSFHSYIGGGRLIGTMTKP